MIRSALSIRLDPAQPIRDQIRRAAEVGAKGIVVEASDDLAPGRLSDTGRREVRHLLRSAELSLVGVHLPTRRGFDTLDQIEDRLARADRVFEMAYDLGSRLVLVRAGAIPPPEATAKRTALITLTDELATRADHRGLQLAFETGTEPGSVMNAFLGERDRPNLAASIDPAYLLRNGFDPVAAVLDLRSWVAHAYLHQAVGQAATWDLGNRSGGRGATSLDWVNYLGAFEEINYQGTMTVWPESAVGLFEQFQRIAASLRLV